MALVPVRITFYSGGRRDQTPSGFIWRGVEHRVTRLVGERLVEDAARTVSREYKVEVEGGRVFTLVYRNGEGYLYQEEL